MEWGWRHLPPSTIEPRGSQGGAADEWGLTWSWELSGQGGER